LSPASLYVYYKVDPGRLRDLREVVAQLFAAIRRESGVRGHWQRRRDDPATYMEVYPDVHDVPRLEALLARECERLRIDRYLAPGSARRVELFVAAD
jgi:quinol monooxygenase YgiN